MKCKLCDTKLIFVRSESVFIQNICPNIRKLSVKNNSFIGIVNKCHYILNEGSRLYEELFVTNNGFFYIINSNSFHSSLRIGNVQDRSNIIFLDKKINIDGLSEEHLELIIKNLMILK